eukprot:1982361-Rhodomonas_salina.1
MWPSSNKHKCYYSSRLKPCSIPSQGRRPDGRRTESETETEGGTDGRREWSLRLTAYERSPRRCSGSGAGSRSPLLEPRLDSQRENVASAKAARARARA